MRRRQALALFGALLLLPSHARSTERLRRIGFLTLRSGPNEFDAAFRDALRALGYVEGRTLAIEYRWAAGSEARANEMAAELTRRGVEVIVAATTGAIRAAMRATKTVPIVMAASADPVVAGVVASHARPAGNVTGLSMVSTDTATKRLELLGELVPGISRIGVIVFGSAMRGEGEPGNVLLVEQLADAARLLGVSIRVFSVTSAPGIEEAFSEMGKERFHALFVQASPLTIDHRVRIAELAGRHALPAMYELEGFVDAGGLLSYGPSLVSMYRRSAAFVDRILKGAKPSDLPIELPDRYELVVNLPAAKVLGLRIPAALLARADRFVR